MTDILRLIDITKRFGPLVANDHISLNLKAGEVLALLGENGAGKTTLVSIIFGHYTADEGRIEVFGKPLPPGQPEAALQAGIGMVHQHFSLADNLTVLENITLGSEPLWSWRRKMKEPRARIAKLSRDFGLQVDPNARIADLTVGERQRVEILKALYREAKILILDEPTAVLTPQETDTLFETLRSLVSKGMSIIFISHKLNEIMRVSDRVAVLRRGKIVAETPTAKADRAGLAEMMVGRAVHDPKGKPMKPGEALFELASVSVGRGQTVAETPNGKADRAGLAEMMVGRAVHDPKGKPMKPGEALFELAGVSVGRGQGYGALEQADLVLHRHEIVGLAGVSGNGQQALAALISGLAHPDAGTMRLFGKDAGRTSPAAMVGQGVGRIPEDRNAVGVVGEMQVWENLISERRRDPGFSKFGWFNFKSIRAQASRLIETYDIRCQGMGEETRLLSGGNIQKLILARVLDHNPSIILADQPARGLDVGAIAYVHGKLLEARERGAGILLISEDLDELRNLADRIVVIYRGRLSRPLDAKKATLAQIGLMMSGQAEAA